MQTMKTSAQSVKSSINSKPKKSSKDRDKRKSQGSSEVNNHNSTEKPTPTKEISNRQYAGLDSECLNIYGEQVSEHYLSEEISNTLSEDINYKLRYIINDALLKARLQGKNAISSNDLEETFENLGIEKVYGAPSCPEWVPFGYPNLYFLNDTQVNLVAIAEREDVYAQAGDPIFTKNWYPEHSDISKSLKNYFTVICESLVSENIELRKSALKNIRENQQIGPIIEWFYNFSYILLSKDITYDCLTLRALDLIRTLEMTTMCRISVSERQLRLLVRLILQRLLKSPTADILQPMCSTLALLCNRSPLKDFVIAKLKQKMTEIYRTSSVAIIFIIKNIGCDAISQLFLPNMNLFLTQILQTKEFEFTSSILEVFNIMYKEDMITSVIYNSFYEIFGNVLVIFSRPLYSRITNFNKHEINFIKVKSQLVKSRQKIPQIERKYHKPEDIDIEQIFDKSTVSRLKKSQVADITWKMTTTKKESDQWKPISHRGIFDVPNPRKMLSEKELLKIHWKKTKNSILLNNNDNFSLNVNQTNVIIGKASLLLPVLKQKKHQNQSKCCDHSLLWYL